MCVFLFDLCLRKIGLEAFLEGLDGLVRRFHDEWWHRRLSRLKFRPKYTKNQILCAGGHSVLLGVETHEKLPYICIYKYVYLFLAKLQPRKTPMPPFFMKSSN